MDVTLYKYLPSKIKM